MRKPGQRVTGLRGRITASSDRGAVLQDLGYGNAMYWSGPEAPVHALWTAVTMPALVLRARQEILPGFGYILPAAEVQRFAAAVPSARVAEIDANHYNDHHARRCHRRHRRVPARELTSPATASAFYLVNTTTTTMGLRDGTGDGRRGQVPLVGQLVRLVADRGSFRRSRARPPHRATG